MQTVERRLRSVVALSILVALLAGVAAGFGVFARGSGRTETVTSVRGERYEMVTDGVYAYNAERVVAEGIGWDLATLILVVPTLLVTAIFVARGSRRARLLAVGLLGYFFYQYLMYAVYWDIGPLFPLYIVIYALSALGIALTIATIPVGELPAILGRGFPRRSVAVLNVVVAVVLLGMWSSRIATVLSGTVQGELLGQDTLDVQALDLGLIVPLALIAAGSVWRRRGRANRS